MSDHPDPNACTTMGGGKPTSAYCMLMGCAGMNATLPELIALVTLKKGLTVYAVWLQEDYQHSVLVSLHLTEQAAMEKCFNGNSNTLPTLSVPVPFSYDSIKVEE